jgi:hypothetical protein
MGEVIRPWHFRARSYQKWQIENKRAKEARDAALRARGIDPLEALRAARRARWSRTAATSPRLKNGSADGSGEKPQQ